MPTATSKAESTIALVDNAWTALDSPLTGRFWFEGRNTSDVAIGVRIATSQPTAGDAWNANGAEEVGAGGEIGPWPLGVTLRVWAKSSAGAGSATSKEFGA